MKTQSLLNLFDLYLQITRVMVLLEQITIMPLVALHSRSVHVNVPKVQSFINQRLHFPKSKHYIHFYLLCHFRRLFMIVIGKKRQLLQF